MATNNNLREQAQKKLNDLYYEYFVIRARKESDSQILSKLSTPFLIKIPENYFKGKRIWYVGQDTFTWYGKYLEKFLEEPDSVKYALDVYEEFFSKSRKTPIWRYYEDLFGEKKKNVICNNIYKCDHIEGYGKWYTASNMVTQKGHLKKLENLIALQGDIFKKELEILKPELIFLMTSHKQDAIAFQKCTDRQITCEVVTDKFSANILGRVVSDFLPDETYRTYHPGFLGRMAKDKKDFIFEYLKSKI